MEGEVIRRVKGREGIGEEEKGSERNDKERREAMEGKKKKRLRRNDRKLK